MRRAFFFAAAGAASFLAGSCFYFWLEERRLDREWISGRAFATRVHR